MTIEAGVIGSGDDRHDVAVLPDVSVGGLGQIAVVGSCELRPLEDAGWFCVNIVIEADSAAIATFDIRDDIVRDWLIGHANETHRGI